MKCKPVSLIERSGADYLICCTLDLAFEGQILETMLRSHSRSSTRGLSSRKPTALLLQVFRERDYFCPRSSTRAFSIPAPLFRETNLESLSDRERGPMSQVLGTIGGNKKSVPTHRYVELYTPQMKDMETQMWQCSPQQQPPREHTPIDLDR